MSNITDEVLKKSDLVLSEEFNDKRFQRYDDGSAEVEVLELLYSLVRITKPKRVLETGTYFGLTGAYMALALRDNGEGHLDSIEWEKQHVETAKVLWNKLEVSSLITEHNISSMDFEPDGLYDFVLLDTEPQLRYAELQKFWGFIRPGAIIVIHDLSYDLGSGAPQFWLNKEIINNKIKDHEVQVLSFLTPRGLTVLQKFNPSWESFKLLTNG